MPASAFRATIDRSQEKRMLAAYSPRAVKIILKEAASLGGKAAKQVVQAAAPVGTSQRLSQYYRQQGLKHGALRASVKQAAIRRGDTIGRVIGPIGKKAFTRHWVEARTHWLGNVASTALSVAREASEALLEQYARGH